MLKQGANSDGLRVVSVVPSLTAGGVGSVSRYAAEGLAGSTNWRVTLLSLHDDAGADVEDASGLKVVCLGLKADCPRQFLKWLDENPQDLVLTSDVAEIEDAFAYLPSSTRHVVHVHDSMKRYRNVAIRHAASLDGVLCVASHIESSIQRELTAVDFHGSVRTVYNGARFPPLIPRIQLPDRLRLLFVGRMDPLKGIDDLPPILDRLRRMKVPVQLTIVGGRDDGLKRRFEKRRLDHLVTWLGQVSHEKCYELASEHDVIFVNSRREPFGMVTIEAMSMGCVPIAYNVPSGSTEIIQPNSSGILVPIGNFDAWASAVRDIHRNRQRLEELSKGAIFRARSRFSTEIVGEELRTFLSGIAMNPNRPAIRRLSGLPPASMYGELSSRESYQRLPGKLRKHIRRVVLRNPVIGNFILRR